MDVLRLPLIGPLIRWRHFRLALQLLLFLTAVVVVLHGFLGPQIGPRNLSTVLTSVHWRGLLIIALLAVGNLFCTACPMVLARDAGRRFLSPRFAWPARLRGKWLAIGLLTIVLFAYELFDLWNQPAGTAWLVIGYFGLALFVDLLFKGATFCKHVCPIGQFNYIASTVSPTELKIKDAQTCRSCSNYDCISGRQSIAPLRLVQRGCELGLFLPGKVGNLDCTLCFDCVHACPYDNIALTTRVPGLELLEAGRRSGVGRLEQRADLAALAVVFTFAAMVNAFAMTAPAVALERQIGAMAQVASEGVVLAIVFISALFVLPALLLSGAAAVTRAAAGSATASLRTTAHSYAFALVPFGLGVWLAHYGFHLLTGILAIVPVAQSASIDLLGRAALGEPAWSWAGMRPGAVYPIQLGFVLLGAVGSAGLVHALSLRDYPTRPALASAPWLALVLALTIAALWILGQPMEMRGLGGIG